MEALLDFLVEATESAKESNSAWAGEPERMETFASTRHCCPSLHRMAHSLRPGVRPYDEGKEATHQTKFPDEACLTSGCTMAEMCDKLLLQCRLASQIEEFVGTPTR